MAHYTFSGGKSRTKPSFTTSILGLELSPHKATCDFDPERYVHQILTSPRAEIHQKKSCVYLSVFFRPTYAHNPFDLRKAKNNARLGKFFEYLVYQRRFKGVVFSVLGRGGSKLKLSHKPLAIHLGILYHSGMANSP